MDKYDKDDIDKQAEREANALHSQGRATNSNYRRLKLQLETYGELEFNKMFRDY